MHRASRSARACLRYGLLRWQASAWRGMTSDVVMIRCLLGFSGLAFTVDLRYVAAWNPCPCRYAVRPGAPRASPSAAVVHTEVDADGRRGCSGHLCTLHRPVLGRHHRRSMQRRQRGDGAVCPTGICPLGRWSSNGDAIASRERSLACWLGWRTGERESGPMVCWLGWHTSVLGRGPAVCWHGSPLDPGCSPVADAIRRCRAQR